jgi:hypothetical protein
LLFFCFSLLFFSVLDDDDEDLLSPHCSIF